MDRKYKSEAMEPIYEDALAMFEVGAISAERMRYYENACLAPETTVAQAPKRSGLPPIPKPIFEPQKAGVKSG
jgi:hypothetical protein